MARRREVSMTAPTILVVDDDSVIRDVTRALLEKAGYVVHTAGDGEAAMTSLTSLPVDVVLIDIMMPRKEGLETIIELKQRHPKIVVFAMSASGANRGHDFLQTAAKFGADGTLRKPFSAAQLLALLNSRFPRMIASTSPSAA
jgi:CheY-like chemotaxis protein